MGSYEEVAKDPAVEIVYVGMLHPFHFESAMTALQNGKHVLVEKPATCSLSDTKALAQMVRPLRVTALLRLLPLAGVMLRRSQTQPL